MARQIATNDIGRIFIQRSNLLGCCPEYLGSVGMSGINQERSETVRIKLLSEDKAGVYDLVEKIPGQLNEVTFDLVSYLGLNGISVLRELFQTGCESTMHVHFGTCSNPKNFYEFDKALVLEGVLFNSYSTDDLITIESDNKAVIQENTSAEADMVYEYFKEKKFSLVSCLEITDPVMLHLMRGDTCSNMCVFCRSCTPCRAETCPQDFYTVPTDSETVATYDYDGFIYTIEVDGEVKKWDYDLIIDETLSCYLLTTISLSDGETITAAAFYKGVMVVGTSDGRVLTYEINSFVQNTVLLLQNEISAITANKYGVLLSDNLGNIYYSKDNGETWSNPTSTVNGAVGALMLHNEHSWIVSYLNGNLFYTNDGGKNYTQKKYPRVAGQYLKAFDISNHSIFHAINDSYYYQTYDSGCAWHAIDLSKYFSSLYSLVVCPTNPYVVYIAGLSADGTETYIVEVRFGA